MSRIIIESLESRLLLTATVSASVVLVFPRFMTFSAAGSIFKPIAVWAEDATARIVRSFDEPVAFNIGDGPST